MAPPHVSDKNSGNDKDGRENMTKPTAGITKPKAKQEKWTPAMERKLLLLAFVRKITLDQYPAIARMLGGDLTPQDVYDRLATLRARGEIEREELGMGVGGEENEDTEGILDDEISSEIDEEDEDMEEDEGEEDIEEIEIGADLLQKGEDEQNDTAEKGEKKEREN